MIKFTPLLLAAGLLLALPNRADAGTITGQNPTGPYSFSSGNPYRAEQTQPDLVRYVGSGFTQGSTGSTQTRTLSFTGSFTANQGDLFSALYNISVRLDQFANGGSFQFNLFVTPMGMSEMQLVSDGGALTPTSSQTFQNFSGSQSMAAGTGAGTFRGELTITMIGLPGSADGLVGTPPPTATLTINEIALQVAPIPEPSTYALLAVGLLAVVHAIRRRRLAA